LKFLHCLTVLSLFLNCGSASADNWRDDNPNQPNGYAASMYRYHHGTPDDDGPHDGYRASEARARHGLDRFAPPSSDDDSGGSRWGGDSNSSGRWGGGDGSGLGRHFRQGQAEGEAIWSQRLRNHMQAASPMQNSGFGGGTQFGSGMNTHSAAYGNEAGGYAGGAPRTSYSSVSGGGYGGSRQLRMQELQRLAAAYKMQSFHGNNQMPHLNVNNQVGATSGNCQYAPSYGAYNNGYSSSTALQQAVARRPFATLLRNSQGGFNKMYAEN